MCKKFFNLFIISLIAVLFIFPTSIIASNGRITIGVYTVPRQLDPHKMKAGEEYIIGYLVFDGLTDLDRKLTAQPRLAKSWTSSEDLKTWIFELNSGVKFHDGRNLTAEDVVATFHRILDPKTGSPGRANLSMIESVKVFGPNRVGFVLSTAYAQLPELLADRWYKIVPKDAGDSISLKPIGTGPFVMKEFRLGEKAVLAKNPSYWQKGVPKADEVVMKIFPEPVVAVTALEMGEIDLLWEPPLEHLKKLQSNKKIVVDVVPTPTYDVIAMRADLEPYNNNKVRLALKYATDKKKLVEAALFGYGTPIISPITPASAMYDPTLKDLTQDYAKAKSLLAEAGYPNGLKLTMFIPEGRPTRERLGIAAKEMWKPASVEVELQRVPWDKFIAEIEGKAPLSANGFYARPTVDMALFPWFHSKGSWNIYHWSSPQMDSYLEAARKATVKEEQRKYYTEVQKLIRDESGALIPYVLNHNTAFRKNIKGFQTHPMLWLDLRNAFKAGK